MREERGQVLELARYVVLNPVRAGMCAVPEQWPWSYSQKEIASAFEIHYASVSRIVKVKTDLSPSPP